MEVTEFVTLRGPRDSVLRDAALLLEFLGTLSTVVTDEAVVQPQDDNSWPHYANRFLSFRGQTATISKRQELILRPLLEAKGAVVSRSVLKRPFDADGLGPNEMNVNLSRLRSALRCIPSISIESVGDGCRLTVKV